MKIKSIRQCKNLKNKTVLVRCDLDVPLGESKVKSQKLKVLDDTRLKACIPTINFLLKNKVKQIILMGYRGRPKGVDKKLSLKPVAKYLEKLLRKKIEFTNEILEEDQDNKEKIIMLENVRFHSRERMNCKKRAKELAKLGDIYIMEAFANSHRSESSIDAIQNYLPSYAGLHLEKEIKNLSFKKKKPLTLIIGGAKIETKLPVIRNFVKKADYVLIGGGVANTFLKAQGMSVKKSLVDNRFLKTAKKLLKYKNIILPDDCVWSENKILDIGKQTIKKYSGIIKKSKVIIWNGPLGYIEDKNFAKGTNQIAKEILKNDKAKILIGGGDTNLILKGKKILKNVFVSTGGGAMLEFLAGKKMPGLRKIYK